MLLSKRVEEKAYHIILYCIIELYCIIQLQLHNKLDNTWSEHNFRFTPSSQHYINRNHNHNYNNNINNTTTTTALSILLFLLTPLPDPFNKRFKLSQW